uniref:Inhibitor I9 domain-containing protein n=1 Tax=Picea sitchensis TaxID=3332 RepID=A9NN04_PICSI|nr:unknown [Picea sitchensis]ABK22276.1 unknown [Picea sitchensis]
MGPKNTPARPSDVYLVMMEYDPEYDRLRRDRNAASELEKYVSNKHDILLQRALEPGTYKKRFSWVIVDGFAAEITSDQAEMLRSADGVRVVEKDQEIGL